MMLMKALAKTQVRGAVAGVDAGAGAAAQPLRMRRHQAPLAALHRRRRQHPAAPAGVAAAELAVALGPELCVLLALLAMAAIATRTWGVG
jgi:hypothetical protein